MGKSPGKKAPAKKSAAKPAAKKSAPKPSKNAVPKPSASTAKPATTPKPSASGTKPSASGAKPNASGAKPNASGTKPTKSALSNKSASSSKAEGAAASSGGTKSNVSGSGPAGKKARKGKKQKKAKSATSGASAKKPDGFSKLEGEDDADQEDQELDALLSSRKAKKKAPPSAAASATLSALRDITATKTREQSRKCRQHFTFIFILAALGAAGVAATFSAYNLFQNPMKKYLWPPTEQAMFSTTRIYMVCILMFLLGILGFALLTKEITSLIVGLLYMIFLSCVIYWSASAGSRAYYVYRSENFNHVINYSVKAYEDNNKKLPAYVDAYQRTQKCCAWGNFYWSAWPKELNFTDIPPSCCKVGYPDCGKDVISKRPSGYLAKLSYEDYTVLKGKVPGFVDFQQIGDNVLRNSFGILNTQKRPEEDDTADEWLREIDEAVGNLYHFSVPAPVVPSSNINWKVGPVGLTPRMEIPIRIYPRKEPKNTLKAEESLSLVYFSRGLEEFYRIKAHVHGKACEKAQRYANFRGIDGSVDLNMMKDVKKLMLWAWCYSMGLAFVAVVMAAGFWYYFSRATARALAEEELPKDFQDLDIEAVNFGDEDRGAEEDEILRAKVEKIKQQREEKKQAVAAAKAIADKRHAEHQDRKAERRALRRKRRRERGEDVDENESSSTSEGDDDQSPTEEEDMNKELKRSKKSVRFGGEESQEAPAKVKSDRKNRDKSPKKVGTSKTKSAGSKKSDLKSKGEAKTDKSKGEVKADKPKVKKSRSGTKSSKVAPAGSAPE